MPAAVFVRVVGLLAAEALGAMEIVIAIPAHC